MNRRIWQGHWHGPHDVNLPIVIEPTPDSWLEDMDAEAVWARVPGQHGAFGATPVEALFAVLDSLLWRFGAYDAATDQAMRDDFDRWMVEQNR